jgi:hypothetical protein
MLCRHRDPSHMAMRLSAWCRACQHTVRLDLRALVAGGHGDVPLIHLPMRCRCGSDQFGIIVGAVSAGKSAACPGAAPHARAMTAAAAGLASCSPASRAPPADRCAGSCFSPAEACGRTHPRRRVVPFPQGRHVRPLSLSRYRHARATPQPVAGPRHCHTTDHRAPESSAIRRCRPRFIRSKSSPPSRARTTVRCRLDVGMSKLPKPLVRCDNVLLDASPHGAALGAW